MIQSTKICKKSLQICFRHSRTKLGYWLINFYNCSVLSSHPVCNIQKGKSRQEVERYGGRSNDVVGIAVLRDLSGQCLQPSMSSRTAYESHRVRQSRFRSHWRLIPARFETRSTPSSLFTITLYREKIQRSNCQRPAATARTRVRVFSIRGNEEQFRPWLSSDKKIIGAR